MKDLPTRATLVFATLTALLTAALFLQIRRTRALEAALDELARKAARGQGLEEGRQLEPVALRDAAGATVTLAFRGAVGTLVLFHSGACDACASTAPRWRSAVLEAGRPDLQVVVAQTDGESGRVDLAGLPASLVVPLPPLGWHAGLPSVPATLVVDAEGVLRRAWFGELDEAERLELVRTLAELGSG